uniref:hypothetical protein n=1 Tax=Catenulispora pinisilvae TaxID=2705253 RepID=UPI001E36503C
MSPLTRVVTLAAAVAVAAWAGLETTGRAAPQPARTATSATGRAIAASAAAPRYLHIPSRVAPD